MYFKFNKDAYDVLLHRRLYKQCTAPAGTIPMPSEHHAPANVCTSGHARTHRQLQSTCTPDELPSTGRARTHRQLPDGLRASFTIEAAVIVPLSLIIICAAILVSMHIHDLVVIRAVSISSIFEGYSTSSDISYIKELAGETLSARLIVTDNIEVTAENTSDGEYILTCKSSSGNPSALFGSYISSSLSSSTVSINISNLSGRDTLLKYKAAKEGLLSVIGTD